MGLILAPQAREATTAISIPVPGSYSGIMGSHRAENGNHGRCCMVIGGHSRWGRAVVAHFGWFLRVCVYVVFCGQQFLARPTLPTMFKIDIGSAKMANFCARKEKNASPNHTNIKACTKFSWCEDFSCLDFWAEWLFWLLHFECAKVCKNLSIRLSSYLFQKRTVIFSR